MNSRSLRRGLAAGLAAVALAGLGAVPVAASAQPSNTARSTGAVAPVVDCAALAGRSFSPGRATITSARPVTKTPGGQPVRFCEVSGTFALHTTFGMLLPTSGWHGQYVQEGCSGLCGFVQLSESPQAGVQCAAVESGQVAYAADDEGHTGGQAAARWARHSLRSRVVYGVTSEDAMARVARTILTAYYGRAPAYSYFDGCSDGGREALMLAQRYPEDFDGIIAGSPGMNMAPQFSLLYAWLVRSNTAADGHQILPAESLPALHAAVLRSCADARGLITDPRRCSFDPRSMRCPVGVRTTSCLTPAQVSAVRSFYRGPVDRRGESLYNGGEPYGSELGWAGAFVMPAADPRAPADAPAATAALNYLNNLAFWPNPVHDTTLADVPFTAAEFRRLDRLGRLLYNANNPDLRAFAAHGGKLIVYHGWADQLIPPWSTVDYYRAVERTAGGFRPSQSFSRLYLIPGAYHCLVAPDGQTATVADFLSPLIAWTQHGTPPGRVATPLWSMTQHKFIRHQTVRPYDALAPVFPARHSLNGHYHYLGRY